MTRLLSSRGLEGKEFEQLLSDCLDRLQAGDTVEGCLVRYPAYAGRLAPLLQMAERLQVPDGPSMSSAGLRAGRARLLAARRAAQLRGEPRSVASRLPRPIHFPIRLRSASRLTTVALTGVLLLGLVLGGGAITVSAASSSLPGSRLYPMKRTTEDVITSLAFTPQLRARAHLAWADRRLEEVGALLARDQVVYRTVLTALQSETERALAAAEQADPEILAAIVEQTEHQQSVLEGYLAQAPEPSRRDLEQALAASAEVNRFAQSSLASKPPGGVVAGPVASETPQPTQQARDTAAMPDALTSTSSPGADQSPEPTGASPDAPAAASVIPGASPAIAGIPEVSTATPGLSDTPSATVKPAKTSARPGSTPELEETSPAAPISSATPMSTALPADTAVPTATLSPTPSPIPALPPVAATATDTPSPTAPPTYTPTATPTETPTPTATSVPDGWDRSGLLFVERGSRCEDGGTVWARVKNNGEAMAGPTDWELWYAASGPPRLGDMIAQGEIPALPSEQEYSIEEAAVRGSGTYQFKVFQRPGHPGAGELWSEDIKFDCSP